MNRLRPLWISCCFLAALPVALPASLLAQTPDLQPPRLVVLCSVDQLGSWVLAAGLPHLPADGGFRRLLDGGVQLLDCAFTHACSETGPGHATIGTGAPASSHGIVRNSWWSPALQREVYCVEDKVEALPEYPEAKDRGPGLLVVPTLGDGLKAHRAGAKVASVAWKDRSAILMAGGSADAVVWMEYKTGNLVTNTRFATATPPWLLEFNRKRAIDAWFGQSWTLAGPASAYAGLTDDRPFESPHGNERKQRTLPQPLTGGLEAPGKEYYAQLYASPFGNTLVRLAAEACVDALQLGQDEVPDLLCVSFSSTDVIGHTFGADSVEARDALLRLDQDLAQLLRFLDQQVGAEQYALFLTADHGVGPTPEAAQLAGVQAGRGLLQQRARSAAEAALIAACGPPQGAKRYIAHVGDYTLFFDPAAVAGCDDGKDPAAHALRLARIAAHGALRAPNIIAAFATEDLLREPVGEDSLRRSLRHALYPGRAGDVQFVMQPYWLDGKTTASHGTPHRYDREVVGIAYGPGLRGGARSAAPVTPGLGAVWLSQLLGIPRPEAAVDVLPAELVGGR